MTFKKGQLILLDYTAKIKDSGEIFETTIEDEAKKHSLHEPNVKYMPKLVSVGEGWVLKGLDDALSETTAGDKKTIEVSPDKGFGERDKGKVRMIPLRKLGEDADKVFNYCKTICSKNFFWYSNINCGSSFFIDDLFIFNWKTRLQNFRNFIVVRIK